MSTKSTISPAQQLANIADAMLSTGPRTEEGKAKARYIARRHGLTGQLAIAITQDHWRLSQVKGIELNSYGLGHLEYAAQAHADTAEAQPPSPRPKPG